MVGADENKVSVKMKKEKGEKEKETSLALQNELLNSERRGNQKA